MVTLYSMAESTKQHIGIMLTASVNYILQGMQLMEKRGGGGGGGGGAGIRIYKVKKLIN